MMKFPGFDVTAEISAIDGFTWLRVERQSDQLPFIIKTPQQLRSNDLLLLRKESSFAASVGSDAVMEAIDTPYDFPQPALIFEDFGGSPMDSFLETGSFPLKAFLSVAINVANALGKIHYEGLVHNNLQPSSIFVNLTNSKSKITDFRYSFQHTSELADLTHPDRLEGAISYMSPERTGRMNRSVDYRTDLYSLGVIFFQMLTGQLPFEASDNAELIHSHIARTPQAVNELVPDIPEVVAAIVARLLQKSTQQRYQSAFGLKYDLENCLTQLDTTGQLRPFPLGIQDYSKNFQVSSEIYGREDEVALLLDNYKEVMEGGKALLLVAGHAGIGKSALINELHKELDACRCQFIKGKYDQLAHDSPYKAVVEAFQGLINQLLSVPEKEVHYWRARLRKALGENAQVIIDVIPEIELIMGKQPPVTELPVVETQNRFDYLFRRFVAVFTGAKHPLVIFTDDLQWADLATLQLIESVLLDPDIKHLFWIVAYRDNEVDATHPLLHMRQVVEQSGIHPNTLSLEGLALQDTTRLVAATLHCSDERALEVAELVQQRTSGNPFFVSEFLKSMYLKHHFEFDVENQCWSWNIDELRNEEITDNVVELMTSRLQELGESPRQVLEMASCIGNSFGLGKLSLVSGRTELELLRLLRQAIEQNLIIPDSQTYRLLRLIDVMQDSGDKIGEGLSFRFAHDRIQQAAYAMLDEDELQRIHYRLANALLESSGDRMPSAQLFEIVNHFNAASEMVKDGDEKLEFVKLNYRAGKQAKMSTAYQAALKYFYTASAHMPDSGWLNQRDLCLRIYFQIAETEYLNRNPEASQKYCDLMELQEPSDLIFARMCAVRMQAFNAQDKLQEGLDVALKGLHRLGVKLPERPNPLQIVKALLATRLQIGFKSLDDLLQLPLMENENIIEALRVISIAAAPAYQARPNLFPILIFTMVRLSVKYGNSKISAYAYSLYGVALTGVLGNFKQGYEYGKLGLKVLERNNARALEPKCGGLYNYFLRHWCEPVSETIQPMVRLAHVAQETGDIEYEAYHYYFFCQAKFVMGENIASVLDEVIPYHNAVINLKQTNQAYVFAILHQVILNLRGTPENPEELSGSAYDEFSMLPHFKEIELVSPIFFTYFYKSVLCYLFGNFKGAKANIDIALPMIEAAMAMTVIPWFYYFESLIHFALKRSGLEGFKATRVRRNIRKIKRWTLSCPANNLHRLALLEAELASSKNQHHKAVAMYERSISLANNNGFYHDAGIACERTSDYYASLGGHNEAALYLDFAIENYETWGANGKVRQLKQRKATLPTRSIVDRSGSAQASKKSQTTEQDLLAVIKASQAISQEIFADKSLGRLMRVVIEHAGAEWGCLLTDREGELVIEAQAHVAGEDLESLQAVPAYSEEATLVPRSIVTYVQRTLTTVVLDNAYGDKTFGSDPYIQQTRPKSLLCSALISQGKVVCTLYLENRLTGSAFTNERLTMLEHLSSQIAVSIENARLAASYKRFVPREFLNLLDKRNIVEVKLGDQVEKEMTVLFTDIRNFTSLSEKMTPSENFAFINEFLSYMGPIIREHNGFIDKYIGDAIMALFTDHHDAVRASISIMKALEVFNQEHTVREINIGVGLNSGSLMLGTVGEKDRMEGTVISDVVNLAARLEGITKYYGVSVVISSDTLKRLKDQTPEFIRRLDVLRVVGRSGPVEIFEIFEHETTELRADKAEAGKYLHRALDLRSKRDWSGAIATLEKGLVRYPEDTALLLQIECIKGLQSAPPSEDWDGSVAAGSK